MKGLGLAVTLLLAVSVVAFFDGGGVEMKVEIIAERFVMVLRCRQLIGLLTFSNVLSAARV